MSSSDDDDAPRGLGLGYGVKRGRRDRDEAALGVFGDGDEPHQRRGLGAKKKSSSGPVMFVSAGKEEAKPPAPAPAPTMSNDDFRAHMAPPPPPKAQSGRRRRRPAARVGAAHEGRRLRVDEKMGFTGRLGKDETGVSRRVIAGRRRSPSRPKSGCGGGEVAAEHRLQKELGQRSPRSSSGGPIEQRKADEAETFI